MSLAVTSGHRRFVRHRRRATARRARIPVAALLALGGTLVLLTTAGILALVWGIVWFGQFAGALPPPENLAATPPFQTTRVLAADESTLLYEITDPEGGRRTVVRLDQVPRHLIEATIATEDPGFFSNPGFEVRSILRAGIDDLTHQQIVSGASTITQQVVRNVLLSPEERADLSARRKVKEIVVAYQVTQTYSKEQILEIYLNQIYYGNRSYGIEAAAEGYFGKPAANLDLAESALLAGLPQAPGYYDPYSRLDEVKDRQRYVLKRMVDQGYISADEAEDAANEELHFVDARHSVLAPHFVAYVSDRLERQLGPDRLYRGGDVVVTSLDPTLQDIAERAVSASLAGGAVSPRTNAAVVALDPQTGHLLAMVGSANYDDSRIAGQVNMALAQRQSAGILSPLTYALAVRQGETLLSPVDPDAASGVAAPTTDAVGPITSAPLTLREALGLGLGPPAMRTMARVGNQNLIDLAERIGLDGFDRRVDYGGNLTIVGARVSPLEVAQVYATLAAGGIAHPPIAITKILDPAGRVVETAPLDESAVLDPGVAYLITSVLADPTVRPPEGPQPLADGQNNVAARLAFSEDHQDAWAVGYTPNLVAVVWVGDASGHALPDGRLAEGIWRTFFEEALKVRPATPFAVPADVVEVSLCKNPACSARHTELALRGTEKAVEAINAQAIAVPTPATGSSRTPLVDRARSTTRAATPVARQGVAITSAGGLITVPSLARTNPDEARQRLVAIGLANAPLVQYRSSSELSVDERSIPVGQVIGTSPAAGQQVAPGTSIVLIVRRN